MTITHDNAEKSSFYVDDLTSLFNICHIVPFPHDNFCLYVKSRHNGLDLPGLGLRGTDDLKVIKLFRIADGAGRQEGAS